MHVWGCEIPPGSRNSQSQPIRLNKASSNTLNLVPSVEFLISHPHETIHLTLIQYEGGGKQFIIQSVPKLPFPSIFIIILLEEQLNSTKGKNSKILSLYMYLLQIDRNEKTIFFVFFGGGMRKSDIFFIYLIVHVTSCIVLQHYHPGSECE